MRALPVLLVLLCCLLVGQTAAASSLEKLLMPGPVSKAHIKQEEDCALCHDRKDRSRQTALCMDCHKDVAADVRAKTGFHGRGVAVGAQCQACHTEHKGRAADIVRLDRDAFDHRLSDFALTGAHAATACDGCHKPGKRLREAPHECVACHRNDDVHKGKLGTDCAACHGTTVFKVTRFDHSKTRFPLRDAHARATCASCHRDPAFKGAPLQCFACHAADDVHHGSRGTDCGSCHGVAEWKKQRFDHSRVTGFALTGRHAEVTCNACHRSGDLKAPVPKDCQGCHASEDAHAGRFGKDCARCHDTAKWRNASFDHAVDGHFPLRGAHEKVACHTCHTGVVGEQKLGTSCNGCHRADDVHRGSMGEHCDSCHRETGWRDGVRFDHDLARFPLIGLHATVACEECHVTRAYRETPRDCVSCHRKDDVHKGSLTERCATCHNPNGWKFWQFDHGKSTHFPLTGAHAPLECKRCHLQPADKVKLPTDCGACHARDDVHDGRFGTDCGRCHDARTFKRPRVLH